MLDLIAKNILNGELSQKIKREGKVNIENAILSRDKQQLQIDLVTNFVIPHFALNSIMQMMEARLSRESNAPVRVNISYKVKAPIQKKAEILKFGLEYLVNSKEHEIKGFDKNLLDAIIVKSAVSDDEGTVFYCRSKGACDVLCGISKDIDEEISRIFGISLVSKFLWNEAMAKSYEPKTSPDDSGKGNGGSRQKRNTSFIKKGLKGEVIQISDIKEAVNNKIIEGEVFKLEKRNIKEDLVLLTIGIFDNTASTVAKAFLKHSAADEVLSSVKEGDVLRVSGNIEFDAYDRSYILKAKHAEKLQKREGRKDNADVKRVELHAHTKMSAMDGISNVTELVKTAASFGHKRIAITDHGVVQAFPEAMAAAKSCEEDIKIIYGLEGYMYDDERADYDPDSKKQRTYHIIILAKTREGLKNLYKLVSHSHINDFYRKPRLARSVIRKYREGLILGSACVVGEIYSGFLDNIDEAEMDERAKFYDYLEIQPIGNNSFLKTSERYPSVSSDDDLKEINKKIISLADKNDKPVCATCDLHYIEESDAIYRKILMAGQGYDDLEGDEGLFFRTTEEMLGEFEYLGEELAKKVVIDNTVMIADSIEDFDAVPEGKYPPHIENADQILNDVCRKKMEALYGDNPPAEIEDRMHKELSSIIDNGYAVLYVAAMMLVNKSNEDGYIVGSRGSVGSSLVAMLSGITEVNPLRPHYRCDECKYFEWGDDAEYDCGIDMPEKVCPDCNKPLKREGFTIPFETFLGFDGDKEPDIDLNFAGEYQASAHKYVEEIFGSDNVFRAGTVSTIQGKTAYGFVKKYIEETNRNANRHEVDRLVSKCTGVRRSTGQHPGGVIIVPTENSIYEFTPIQRPANDMKSDVITTHFDYHSIEKNLLKLDILGHEAPSIIKKLEKITGVDPLAISLSDKDVDAIFNGVSTLGIEDDDYLFDGASFGIPEFGTKLVRSMLAEVKPGRFADLLRISGFSHGTGVWQSNARELIKNKVASMQDVISTRDDIMNYLIQKGLEPGLSFKIMEAVRKGRGLTPEQEKAMLEAGCPKWYIESCNKIEYMFPRAHAVAYVIMAYRIAYFKVNFPLHYYAVYFEKKIADFDLDMIAEGKEAVKKEIETLYKRQKLDTTKEEDRLTVLELAYEMMARGFGFIRPILKKSKGRSFVIEGNDLIVPMSALNGVGSNASKKIDEELLKGDFSSIQEFSTRTGIGGKLCEELKLRGVFEGIADSDQLSLFD